MLKVILNDIHSTLARFTDDQTSLPTITIEGKVNPQKSFPNKLNQGSCVIHFLSPNWAFSWHAPQWYYCTTAVPSQTCPPLLISLSHSVLTAEQVTARPASVDR